MPVDSAELLLERLFLCEQFGFCAGLPEQPRGLAFVLEVTSVQITRLARPTPTSSAARARAAPIEGFLEVSCSIGHTEDRTVLVDLSARFRVAYTLRGPGQLPSRLGRTSQKIIALRLLSDVWPHWRSYAHLMAGPLGIPSFLLPLHPPAELGKQAQDVVEVTSEPV